MQRMIFDKINCYLKMDNLVCLKWQTEFLGGIIFDWHKQSEKPSLSVRLIFKSYLFLNIFETVNDISHSFCSFPQFPIGNALCYSIINMNKNMNRTKLKKTNKTHIYVYIFTLFSHGSVFKSRPMNVWHIAHKCSKK